MASKGNKQSPESPQQPESDSESANQGRVWGIGSEKLDRESAESGQIQAPSDQISAGQARGATTKYCRPIPPREEPKVRGTVFLSQENWDWLEAIRAMHLWKSVSVALEKVLAKIREDNPPPE